MSSRRGGGTSRTSPARCRGAGASRRRGGSATASLRRFMESAGRAVASLVRDGRTHPRGAARDRRGRRRRTDPTASARPDGLVGRDASRHRRVAARDRGRGGRRARAARAGRARRRRAARVPGSRRRPDRGARRPRCDRRRSAARSLPPRRSARSARSPFAAFGDPSTRAEGHPARRTAAGRDPDVSGGRSSVGPARAGRRRRRRVRARGADALVVLRGPARPVDRDRRAAGGGGARGGGVRAGRSHPGVVGGSSRDRPSRSPSASPRSRASCSRSRCSSRSACVWARPACAGSS